MESTVGAAVADAARRLAEGGCETPRLDAEVLMAAALGCGRALVLAGARDPLPGPAAERFAALVGRRMRREPVAYLVGEREFWSLDLGVDPRVLVPRPETELLVEAALAEIAARGAAGGAAEPFAAVDVGTGSGAIALAIAATAPARQRGRVIALDRSAAALAVARGNLARHRGALRWPVWLLRGDLLGALRPASVDLVVANPPYLSRAELAAAPPELAWEPREALEAEGDDGLGTVRALAVEAAVVLRPGGLLACEIGAGQGEGALRAARAAGLADPAVRPDLAGRSRALVARRPGDRLRERSGPARG